MKENCCNCFKVISTRSRFKIFEHLKVKKGERVNISELVQLTGLRQPTVTFHVNALSRCGMVKKTRSGREVWCKTVQKCQDCPLYI